MRNVRFTVLLNEAEQDMLETVARNLRRSRGAAFRELLIAAANEFQKPQEPRKKAVL